MIFGLEKLSNLKELVLTLAVGLNRLDFRENFESLEVKSLKIQSGQELSVRNSLNFIPSICIIVKKQGNGNITSGDTEDTTTFLYLKNHGPDEAVVNVIWMR